MRRLFGGGRRDSESSDASEPPLQRVMSLSGIMGRRGGSTGPVDSLSSKWMRSRIRAVHGIPAHDQARLIEVIKAAFHEADADRSGSLPTLQFVRVLESMLKARVEGVADDDASDVAASLRTPARSVFSIRRRRGEVALHYSVRQLALAWRLLPRPALGRVRGRR